MRPENWARRYWILTLIVGVAAALFSLTLVVSGNAAVSENPPPIWHSFQVTDEPVMREVWGGKALSVYENYILWSEEHYFPLGTGGTPSCGITDTLKKPYDSPSANMFDGYADNDICVYNRQTGTITRLTNSDESDTEPSMDGDWVVFIRTASNVPQPVLYNMVNGQEVVISLPLALGAVAPAIHGDWLAFGNIFTGQMYAYQINASQLITLTQLPGSYNDQPAIYENIVVWNQKNNANQHHLLGYDLTSQSIFTISEKTGYGVAPRIYGDLIVWNWNGNIIGYDLSAKQSITITNDAAYQGDPDIYENIVIWSDYRHGRSDIYGTDLQTGEIFSVTQNNPLPGVGSPDIWENVIVWHGPNDKGVAAAIKMGEFSFMPILDAP